MLARALTREFGYRCDGLQLLGKTYTDTRAYSGSMCGHPLCPACWLNKHDRIQKNILVATTEAQDVLVRWTNPIAPTDNPDGETINDQVRKVFIGRGTIYKPLGWTVAVDYTLGYYNEPIYYAYLVGVFTAPSAKTFDPVGQLFDAHGRDVGAVQNDLVPRTNGPDVFIEKFPHPTTLVLQDHLRALFELIQTLPTVLGTVQKFSRVPDLVRRGGDLLDAPLG